MSPYVAGPISLYFTTNIPMKVPFFLKFNTINKLFIDLEQRY